LEVEVFGNITAGKMETPAGNLSIRSLGNRGFCMVHKKKLMEYEEKIKQALVILEQVSEDTTTPRNIRRAAKESMGALQVTEYTPAVRASNTIFLLDDVLQDPNMPPYTRVKLWNVVSTLEVIRD